MASLTLGMVGSSRSKPQPGQVFLNRYVQPLRLGLLLAQLVRGRPELRLEAEIGALVVCLFRHLAHTPVLTRTNRIPGQVYRLFNCDHAGNQWAACPVLRVRSFESIQT